MQAEHFRVALVGYGYAGQTFHAPLIAAEHGLTLTRVASRQAEKIHALYPQVAVDPDPMAAITADDVDVVVIASPNDTHAPLARAALQAGKHVVVDKPFALNREEAREVAAVAQKCGRVLAVFHNRRWDSDFLSIKALIDAGDLGEIGHFESHIDRFRPAVRDRWREGAGPGSGIWFDLGPHLIDQALLLFGVPERVNASLARLRQGALADDWAHVVLEYPQRRIVLHASMLVAGGSPRFIVHGTKDSVIKAKPDQQEAQLLAGITPGAAEWGQDHDALQVYGADGVPHERPAVVGDQRQFYNRFVHALRGGENPVPPLQALSVMAVLDAAFVAAQTGQAVAPDVTDYERQAWL